MEVHPPHHRIEGWRDALVHLALITVGLLIALGLEAAVEALHHQRQVGATRVALAREMAENRERIKNNLAIWRAEVLAYKANLALFRSLKSGSRRAADPSTLAVYWRHYFDYVEESAWQTAQGTGITAYMPREEVQELYRRYQLLDYVAQKQLLTWETINRFKEYAYADSDLTKMSPQQIDRQIALSLEVLADMFQVGAWMYNLALKDPGFPGPSVDELYAMELAPPGETERLKVLRNDYEAWTQAKQPLEQSSRP